MRERLEVNETRILNKNPFVLLDKLPVHEIKAKPVHGMTRFVARLEKTIFINGLSIK